jgi:nicotinamide-nucleotide amidase
VDGETRSRLAETVLARCRQQGIRLAVAESCTGGLLAASLTAVAGASDVFERGFVVYANAAKTELLGVAAETLAAHGAVSAEVACAMAEGVLRRAPVEASVAVTGIAGPTGGSADKPVGLVHLAAAGIGRPTLHQRHVFAGDRDAVRNAATDAALTLLARLLQ